MAIKRFKYNKIVRDGVYNELVKHQATGSCHGIHSVIGEQLQGDKALELLKRKLQEECLEVIETDPHQTADFLQELADVIEVINGICSFLHINKQELESIRLRKLQEKGGFEGCFFIDQVMVDEQSRLGQYCMQHSDRYPEVISE